MKNYPHLYTPVTKKASFSNQLKTHKKTTSIINPHQTTEYNKIPSSKTINHTNNPLTRRASKHPRINSRSIQQMYLDRSSQDNYDLMQRKQLLLQEHRQMNQYYQQRQEMFDPFMQNTSTIPYHQADRYSVQSNEDSELFQRSYQKIGQIKFHVHNKNIDHELNQVLELIKEEKLRANETVKTLKKAADHYKKLCETVTKAFVQTGINTEEQLDYFKEVSSNDMAVQCGSEEKIKTRQTSPTFSKVPESAKKQDTIQQRQTQKSPEPYSSPSQAKTPSSDKKVDSPAKSQKIDGKQKEIYTKLATMLQDMNINSKEILPQDIELNFEVKNYKNLTQQEVIKIQKFFIKKLVQKIPK